MAPLSGRRTVVCLIAHVNCSISAKVYVFFVSFPHSELFFVSQCHICFLFFIALQNKGERRNILHESPQNCAFRGQYLRQRFQNLANDVPRLPEIFLDESYCHANHLRQKTWVPTGGVVHERGRGNLVVIFGAFAVFANGGSNKIAAELVPRSVLVWDPSAKTPVKTSSK